MFVIDSVLQRIGVRERDVSERVVKLSDAGNTIVTRSDGSQIKLSDLLSWGQLSGTLGGRVASLTTPDILVTPDTALKLPAVWCAVDFISSTMARLPLRTYRRRPRSRADSESDDSVTVEREEVFGQVAQLLQDAPNPDQTAYQFKKVMFQGALGPGRAYALIKRNAAGNPIALWPLEYGRVNPRLDVDRVVYDYAGGSNRKKPTDTHPAEDIIDLPFMLRPDMVKHWSPIERAAETIALGLAAEKYGAKIFKKGGIPTVVVEAAVDAMSPEAIQRAQNDIEDSITMANDRGRPLILPAGHKARDLGLEPSKMQMVELQGWIVNQIARMYSLPPTFLQDLTNGTKANTEQQDLSFAKHVVGRWATQFEQECNLKLFGRRRSGRRSTLYCDYDLSALLRGDFRTRMEAHARAVQMAIKTPNEVRAEENLPPLEGGDHLYIQGATVPLRVQADLKDGQATGAMGGAGALPIGGGDDDDA